MRGVWGLLLVVLVAGCSAGDDPAIDPGKRKAAADAAAAEGRWVEAASLYGEAFALEDPVPSRAKARAFLALRRAWALKRADQAADALAWLRWAERLDPTLYPLHLERAMIHDGHIPHLAAPETALVEYERYLEGWRAAGEPAAEAEMASHARGRVDELTSAD